MQKYELDFEGYEALKFSVDNAILTSKTHRIHLNKMRIINGRNQILKFSFSGNYHMVSLNGSRYVHRIMWEHCNGVIPDGLEIDHKDDNPLNNKIENLQLLTHQQNLLKAAKNRNYEFVSDNHNNKHVVKVIDTITNDVQICASLYSAGLLSGVNCGIVKMCCEKKNNCKSGISKINNHKYIFEYTNEAPTIINKRFGRLYRANQAKELNDKYLKDNKQSKKMNLFLTQCEKEANNLKTQLAETETKFRSITLLC